MFDKIINCAIYTRKSSEDGLEQEFNSLDNQYEFCINYLKSLNDPNIKLVPTRYDDGGFSGGNTNRPALQRLFDDIRSGLVNRIIVYKLDRLTRNIRDFFSLHDVMDQYNVEFISVTENQLFNTTSAGGRLIINMFLSFAQFERENAGDRIRDKFANSKAKGMWMGGRLPYGYDLGTRCLLVNETEADIVRLMYKTFSETHSIGAVCEKMNEIGAKTKIYTSRQGITYGGRKFSTIAVLRILQNPLYNGTILYHEKEYKGQHTPIIEKSMFDLVQSIFKAHEFSRKRTIVNVENRVSSPAMLTGLLQCGCCKSAMTPTFCVKGHIRYRYYRCYKKMRKIEDDCPISQIRACEIERVVMEQVLLILKSREFFIQYISAHRELDVSTTHSLFNHLDEVWDTMFDNEKFRILQELIAQVTIYKDKITIDVKKAGLNKVFDELMKNNTNDGVDYSDGETFQISVDYVGKRLANGAKIIVPATAPQDKPRFNGSLSLAKHLSRAYEWRQKIASGEVIQKISADYGINGRDIRFSLRLLMIDPQIVEAILSGRAPEFLTYRFMKQHPIPLLWNEQRKLYGFNERKM